jgi:acyl-CoA dehydrogenase
LVLMGEQGAGFSGASAIHMNISVCIRSSSSASDEQKRRLLPQLIAGKEKTCFAVTEPDAGLDTTRLKTRAVRAPSSGQFTRTFLAAMRLS